MLKIFLLLISFGLTVIGFTYLISYLNLLSMGYSFTDYLTFCIKRIECLIGLLGILSTTIIIMKGDKHDIYL